MSLGLASKSAGAVGFVGQVATSLCKPKYLLRTHTSSIEARFLEKYKPEFQKLLNQWKHKYDFDILWMTMERKQDGDVWYHALIKRWEKDRFD